MTASTDKTSLSDYKGTTLELLLHVNEPESVYGEIRFRRAGDYIEHEPLLARELYESRIKSGMYRMREAIQDSMLGLKR